MRFLVLHAYGAENAGDGLLVTETVELLNEVSGGATIDILALYPNSFKDVSAQILNGSVKSLSGILSQIRLLSTLDSYDLVVAVGGGYLRAGTTKEALKTFIAHGLQVRRAGRTSTPVVYLPQSVGPLKYGTRTLLTSFLRSVDRVYLRDDRSMAEVAGANPIRMPDLALLSRNYAKHDAKVVHPTPVLTVRAVHGRVPSPVARLAEVVGEFDGYVQSRGAGNEDEHVMRSLSPSHTLSRDELLTESGPRRVVVAVRLHAALMALNSGHWVIHLAYERKGFGAFADLGLEEYVHNVNSFDVDRVVSQVRRLITSADARTIYAEQVSQARQSLHGCRNTLVGDINSLLAK